MYRIKRNCQHFKFRGRKRMSNFLTKGKFDYLHRFNSRNTSGFSIFGSSDKNDNNFKGMEGLLRRFIKIEEKGKDKSSSEIIRTRAFNIFRIFSSKVLDGEGPSDSTINKSYSKIGEFITKKFINQEGMYAPLVGENLIKVLNEIRYKIMTEISSATDCGSVCVIFKGRLCSPIFDEKISVYINNSETNKGFKNFPFSFNLTGVVLSKETTISIVIPVGYIERIIEHTYRSVLFDLKKIDIVRSNPIVVSSVINKAGSYIGLDIFNSIVGGIYKDFSFMTFARDISSLATALIFKKDPNVIGETANSIIVEVKNLQTYGFSRNEYNIPMLSFDYIARILKEEKLNDIDPTIILDIFEISNEEVNTFVGNFVKGNLTRSTRSPHMFNLRNEYECYVDEESRIIASLVYATRLNYALIFSMLFTKNSVKEIDRANHCNEIVNQINCIDNYSVSSKISKNNTSLIDEIKNQVETMNSLADDIIKLKAFASYNCCEVL